MSEAAEASGPRRVSLQETGFPRLLFELLRGRFTGTLEIDQAAPERGRRTVWFRGGMPVFTDWFDQTHLIGQVLLEQKTIDQQALDRALQEREAGDKLGAMLRRLGALDEGQLRDGLREQCRRRLVDMFSVRMGFVRVSPGDHDLGADDELGQVNVLGLVLAGVLQHYDEIRMTLEMRKDAQADVKATASLSKYAAHFRFSKTDKPIVEALAAGSSLDQLQRLPGVARKHAAQIIYALWACEMLETASEGPKETHITQPMTEYTEALRRQKQGGKFAAREAKMEAEKLVHGEKFGLAIKAVENAYALDPKDPDLMAWMPWCRYQTSTQVEADAIALIADLDKLIEKNPKHAETHYFRGVAQEALGRKEEAIKTLTTAFQLDQRLTDAARRTRALRGEAEPRADHLRHPLMRGHMPKIMIAGGILIGLVLLANIIGGLDW